MHLLVENTLNAIVIAEALNVSLPQMQVHITENPADTGLAKRKETTEKLAIQSDVPEICQRTVQLQTL